MQNELKLNCKHAYVEHIRGRMLRFKLSYETGHRRSRRTIAQGALPLMSVMPHPANTQPQWPVVREDWPFAIPLYHGCAPPAALLPHHTTPFSIMRLSTRFHPAEPQSRAAPQDRRMCPVRCRLSICLLRELASRLATWSR